MNSATRFAVFSFVFVFELHEYSDAASQKTDTYKTNTGLVRGIVKTLPTGKTLDVFLGIPYAKPPLGQLRFKHPERATPWNGIFDADTLSKDCQQRRLPLFPMSQEFTNIPPFSEDCLKINIWKLQEKAKYPVLVFIHAGAFAIGGGSASINDGSMLASEEKVMVVSFNYRVTSFGFLYLDHPDVPGNAGLMDQVMALQWVKENIANFGGNPEQITLMGQSAGAISVIYHFLSPLSKGLFQRGIAESGAPHRTNGFIDKEVSIERARLLGEYLECPTGLENKTDFIRCLREADPQDLVINEPRLADVENDYLIYLPVTDGYFIPDSPLEMIKRGEFNKGELIIGTNKDEASVFLMMFDPIVFSPVKIVPPLTMEHFVNTFRSKVVLNDEMKDLIMSFYFQPELDLQSNLTAMIRFASDLVFNCPGKEVELGMAAAKHTVYKYYFPHRSLKSKVPKWAGSYHSEELHYTLGHALRNPDLYTEEEIQFSKRLMRYWGNFIRTGNPNIPPVDSNRDEIHWPKFTLKSQDYLVLAPNSTSVGTFLRYKTCKFILNTFDPMENYVRKGRSCGK